MQSQFYLNYIYQTEKVNQAADALLNQGNCGQLSYLKVVGYKQEQLEKGNVLVELGAVLQ